MEYDGILCTIPTVLLYLHTNKYQNTQTHTNKHGTKNELHNIPCQTK